MQQTACYAGVIFCPLAPIPGAYTPFLLARCSASGPEMIRLMRSRLAALRFFVIWYWRTLNERSHVAANLTKFKKKRSQCACTTLTPTATRTPKPSSSASAQENHQIFFPKKINTDGWRRRSTSHCQNTKQCWNLLLLGDLPFPRYLCVTSAPGCQVSWRARPPRCRRESKISIPSTHTFAPKEKTYGFSRCGLQTIIFCNKQKAPLCRPC